MRALLIALAGFAAAAQADPVLTVTINPSSQVGGGGQVLPYFGTLHNNTTDTVFINSDSFVFDIAGALDDSPFLNNAPISINANFTTPSFEFFTITVPGGTSPGTYNGQFTVVGGPDSNAMNNLGEASFSVTVPEPSTLSGAAFLACALALRRRLPRTPNS